jgi:hypothetical protein
MTPTDRAAELRRRAYAILITVAAAAAAGRILAVQRLVDPGQFRAEGEADPDRGPWPRTRPEPWPTHGANDRSRWATVRALVDDGTYVVGRRDRSGATPERPYVDTGIIAEDGWQSVDKVLKPDTQEFYSSKPPLLPTLAAGEYWLLKRLFGWSIVGQRWEVMRTILVTINVLGLVVYLWALSRLAELFGATDWGRLFVVAAGCFGTLVTPFLTTFNNHTVATFGAAVALYAAARAAPGGAAGRWGWFALAGFAAGFTAANEFPAAALAAGLLVFLLRHAPGRTLAAFVPAAAVPVAALLLTNYLALGRLTPAYGEVGGPWYQYEGSHWEIKPGEAKRGIDWARYNGEPEAVYAFHLLLGHHGAFSLFPVFLLGLFGMVWGAWRFARGWASGGREPPDVPQPPDGPDQGADAPRSPAPWAELAALALAVSLVVVGFYVATTGNYGGWTSGPRWLMWLTPLWLVAMLPAADRLGGRRAGRAAALALLALSVVSAAYPAWSPWRHPWIYNWMQHHGWIRY